MGTKDSFSVSDSLSLVSTDDILSLGEVVVSVITVYISKKGNMKLDKLQILLPGKRCDLGSKRGIGQSN